MDPIAAKGLGGLQSLGGQVGGVGGVGQKGVAGQFQQVMAQKLDRLGDTGQPPKIDQKAIDRFMQTGRMEALKPPTMSERVAMRDGIAFQPVTATQGAEQAWRPNAVQATQRTDSVAGVIGELNSGQNRLDGIIDNLRSGKSFSQAELLGMQAEVHMLSEQIQLSSKLVDSAMQSLKQVMSQQA